MLVLDDTYLRIEDKSVGELETGSMFWLCSSVAMCQLIVRTHQVEWLL